MMCAFPNLKDIPLKHAQHRPMCVLRISLCFQHMRTAKSVTGPKH